NPPETTSTSPFQSRPSKVQTSSHMGNGGKCPSFCRCISRRAQKGMISTAATVFHPRSFPPSMPPPAPAKSASSRISPLVHCSDAMTLLLLLECLIFYLRGLWYTSRFSRRRQWKKSAAFFLVHQFRVFASFTLNTAFDQHDGSFIVKQIDALSLFLFSLLITLSVNQIDGI